ncbi:uncharacterized protein L201_001832 [Kwoniella dendrophila CBS 6074]|uniref:CST complex subunit Stn1 N-terminal domain-containing protein n=1 Tax=Kwoniella dendrophila CBS 6074 TaxID=1295534 RepID=A0AAX4JNG8_9TREE
MWEKMIGSTILYENFTGKILIGRRKFKDRLLRYTNEVTLYSHGDDEDENGEDVNDEDYFGNFNRLSIFSQKSSSHSRNSSSSSIFAFNKPRSNPTTPVMPSPSPDKPLICPPVSLNSVMPRLRILRIVLSDEFDYHLLFCPRYCQTCPLLEGLSNSNSNSNLEKLVIIGARSPLVVLPTAFSSGTSSSTTPLLTPPTSPNLYPVIPRSKSTGGLPLGLSELTIVLPTGKSYDSKDYEGYQSIFQNKKVLGTIEKLNIVFLISLKGQNGDIIQQSYDEEDDDNEEDIVWQIAYYNSRSAIDKTSYIALADDLVECCLSLPLETEIDIIGIENLDSKNLNINANYRGHIHNKVKNIMEDRIRRQIEIRLKSKNKQDLIHERNKRINFLNLQNWLKVHGKEELGDYQI